MAIRQTRSMEISVRLDLLIADAKIKIQEQGNTCSRESKDGGGKGYKKKG